MGKRSILQDNTAAIAAQFGVSIKALRLYEQRGMLTPARTRAGWRIFGQPEIERLHVILSLKQLGLPLARIAALLKTGAPDLNALLSMQEDLLRANQREAEHALTLVRVAKARLRKQANLSVAELAALVQGLSKTMMRSTPELEELARRVFTPEQIARVYPRELDLKRAARMTERWSRVYSDIDAMMPNGDPLSKRGLAVARRAVALMRETTRGDKDLWNNAARFWQQAIADPRTAKQLPMKKAHYEFLAKAMTELKRRGELHP